MELEEIKESLLNTEDLPTLYNLQIVITENISELHMHKSSTAKDTYKHVELSGKITKCYSMLEVCKGKIDDIKRNDSDFNLRFRNKAKEMLDKETYKNIYNLSRK